MFKHAVISITRETLGNSYSVSEINSLASGLLKVANMVTFVAVRNVDSNTTAARDNNFNLRAATLDLRSRGVNVLLYNGSIAQLVRSGVKADIYFGDDLAVALAKRARVKTTQAGIRLAKNSPTNLFINQAIGSMAKYVTDYDSKRSKSVASTATTSSGSISPKAISAARINRKQSAGRGSYHGQCAYFVRTALKKAGYSEANNGLGNGHDYSSPTLKGGRALGRMGFSVVPNTGVFLAGDIMSYPAHPSNGSAGGRRYGHVQIFDGKNWISDFIQNTAFPWKTKAKSILWRHYVGSSNRQVLDIVLGQNSKSEKPATGGNKKLRLIDIFIPSKQRLQELFAKYPQKSMTVAQFDALLKDVGKLYRVPYDIMRKIAEFEASFPDKPELLKSSAWETSETYRGPMQIGPPNWVDTRKFYREIGISVTADRTAATLAQQVAGMLLYIRNYAGSKKFAALKNQPLDIISVYLVHNQGPGGARNIFTGTKPPGWMRVNISKQSAEVRKLISQRYRYTV